MKLRYIFLSLLIHISLLAPMNYFSLNNQIKHNLKAEAKKDTTPLINIKTDLLIPPHKQTTTGTTLPTEKTILTPKTQSTQNKPIKNKYTHKTPTILPTEKTIANPKITSTKDNPTKNKYNYKAPNKIEPIKTQPSKNKTLKPEPQNLFSTIDIKKHLGKTPSEIKPLEKNTEQFINVLPPKNNNKHTVLPPTSSSNTEVITQRIMFYIKNKIEPFWIINLNNLSTYKEQLIKIKLTINKDKTIDQVKVIGKITDEILARQAVEAVKKVIKFNKLPDSLHNMWKEIYLNFDTKKALQNNKNQPRES